MKYKNEKDKDLFDDEIKQARIGWIVPSVWSQFKRYGSSPITDIFHQLIVYKDNEGKIKSIKFKEFNAEDIKEEDRKFIDNVLNELENYGTFELIDQISMSFNERFEHYV